MDFSVIILAGGKGTRMKSNTVKVLHPLASRPMLAYGLDLGWELGPKELFVVVGFQADRVQEAFARYDPAPQWVVQPEQRGTADAVRCTLPYIQKPVQSVVILYGDVPLLRKATLEPLLARHADEKAFMTVLTAHVSNPSGYGRILRDETGSFRGIIEEADADAAQKQIHEINTGIYCVHLPFLREAIGRLRPDNAQGEYYLTDLVGYAVNRGLAVDSVVTDEAFRALGINTRKDLSEAERIMRAEICARWMADGVTIQDPASTCIEPSVHLEADTVIEPGCHLRGDTRIGPECSLGTGCIVVDSTIGASAHIRPYCVIEASTVGENARVGPMAHLRPGTVLARAVRIGNFVETKNAKINAESVSAHMAYLGDCEIGERVNVGCGTITCNYDGSRKSKTVIEDDVFIGSDTQLIAPVSVGRKAYIGSGSTITEDVPPGSLAIGRARQKVKKGWGKSKRGRRKSQG